MKDGGLDRLLGKWFNVGMLDGDQLSYTDQGTIQGGVVSPLLMNIVLNELDTNIEDELIPKYTKGTRRKEHPEYQRLSRQIQREQKKGNWKRANELRKLYVKYPSKMQNDPNFRRLWYVRYADDTLLGFIGTKQEAETIKKELGNFLRWNTHRFMLEHSDLQDEHIIACVQDAYGVRVIHVAFLPLGADRNTAVYRVVADSVDR